MMKKLDFFAVFSLFFAILFFMNCSINDVSRHNSQTDPGEDFDEITISYNSSILHGETDVEVNKPIQISFEQEINNDSVTPQTFYLKNSSGRILQSRIIKDNKTFTLIPRIPLHPGRTYTAEMRGIKNLNGQRVKPLIITYSNINLDFGLYWYGKNGLCEKYFPGVENAFYSDDKKTVLFTHGWEIGKINQVDPYGRQGFNHESFYYQEDNFKSAKEHNGLKTYVNHSWIDDGWNTGILHWTQFADENNLWGVEAKIWTFDGPTKSSYKYLNEDGMTEYRQWDRMLEFKGDTIEIDSVGHLLGLYVVDSLKENVSENLRLVGHSLGSQLACKLTSYCFENNIIVERVALLDPAWTSFGKNYLGDLDGNGKKDWVGERCRNILFNAIEMQGDKFAVEIYHTTAMNNGIPSVDNNVPLTRRVCDVDLQPWYYDATQIESKHVAARFHYFWSYASQPPIECTVNSSKKCVETGVGPSASTPTERIVEMMNEEYKWSQVDGIYTPDPYDDVFQKIEK